MSKEADIIEAVQDAIAAIGGGTPRFPRVVQGWVDLTTAPDGTACVAPDRCEMSERAGKSSERRGLTLMVGFRSAISARGDGSGRGTFARVCDDADAIWEAIRDASAFAAGGAAAVTMPIRKAIDYAFDARDAGAASGDVAGAMMEIEFQWRE